MVPSPTKGEGNVNPSYKEKIGQTNQAKPARIRGVPATPAPSTARRSATA